MAVKEFLMASQAFAFFVNDGSNAELTLENRIFHHTSEEYNFLLIGNQQGQLEDLFFLEHCAYCGFVINGALI